MKKIISMILCLMLVLSLATTASAYTIQLEAGEKAPVAGHTYSVYQIFTGDLYNGVLSNIVYGSSYAGKTGAVPAAELEALTDAYTFAKELVEGDALGDAVATLEAPDFKAENLDAGYYLIVDDGTTNTHDAISAYIVKVVDDIKMSPKSEVPALDKIISGDDNNVTGDIADDKKSDNVSIGSKVEYTLTSNIPTNADKYDYFYFIINDTLSEGLTFNNDITVTIGGENAVLGTDYYVYTGDDADGYTFQVALANARGNKGEEVVVTYTATLNENAVIGEIEGNPNTANLEYSNNPNFDYNGDEEPGTPPDDDNPGKPNDTDDVPMGETPDAITRTYTTGLKLVKVDENGNILTGAEFKIEGDNLVEILTVETVTYKEDAQGKYWLLTDGTYTTQEPHGDYYKEKTDNRESGYVKVSETEYRVATEEELADESVQLYTLVESNENAYASTATKYSVEKVTYTNKTTVANQTYTAEVNDKGELILTGLGEGTYTITETKEPDGYNKLTDSIKVEIKWTEPAKGSNDCTWEATMTYKNVTSELNMTEGGIFELEIENQSGSTLPETGGIGTTLFYVFGTIMVLGAAVLLITKKRMSIAE